MYWGVESESWYSKIVARGRTGIRQDEIAGLRDDPLKPGGRHRPEHETVVEVGSFLQQGFELFLPRPRIALGEPGLFALPIGRDLGNLQVLYPNPRGLAYGAIAGDHEGERKSGAPPQISGHLGIPLEAFFPL